jgi:BlaI family transcriptional regulator, penicillinase repressor
MHGGLPPLSDLEGDVMRLVWAHGPLTADNVRELLPRRLTDSTIRTVLRRLEGKGYVNHAVDGRAFIYEAAEPRQKVAARAVKRLVDWFCNGSIEELLLGMVDHAMLDRQQLRALAAKVEKAKIKRRKFEKSTRPRSGRTNARKRKKA